MKKEKVLALILAAGLTASQLAACGSRDSSSESKAEETSEASSEERTDETSEESTEGNSGDKYMGQGEVGSKWLAPVIEAYPDAEKPDLKDDFFTAANYDYLSTLSLKEGHMTAGRSDEMLDIMNEKHIALLKDDSITGHDIEICRAVYNAAVDWEARNKAGTAPYEAAFRKILDIKTLDDVYKVISDNDPFLPNLFSFSVSEGFFDERGTYVAYIANSSMLLQDPAEYAEPSQQTQFIMMMAHQQCSYLCGRFGMTDEEANAALDKCYEFETILAEGLPSNEESAAPDYIEKAYNTYTYDELKTLQKNFPLTDILDALEVPKSDTYVVPSPEWLNKLSEVYTEENVEGIRNYLLVHYVAGLQNALDRECYEKNTDIVNSFYGSSGYQTDEEIGLGLIDSLVSPCMDHVYIDKYCTPEMRQEITDIVNEFRDYYREMLQSEDWLSDDTKNKAIEKLDAMKINSLYSDYREDYSDLDIKEGDQLSDILLTISKYSTARSISKLNKPVEEDKFYKISTRQVNAFYDPTDNSINILSGIIQGSYALDQGYEHDLGTLGWVIGHEMTHAFDSNGSKYDKNGEYKDWWTPEDYKAYEERTQKLKDYVGKIIPFEGQSPVNGEIVNGEMAADITSVKAALFIAEKHSGFDYDVYFRALADAMADTALAEIAGMTNSYDEHPLSNIRVNVSVQQSDKFMECYGVEEGDGMYLVPEDRVYIW